MFFLHMASPKHKIIGGWDPLTSSVPKSIKKKLGPEELTGANRWFCPSCNDLTTSTKEIKFIKVETVVIFQLQCYIMSWGNPIKDNRKVKCSSDPLKNFCFLWRYCFLFSIIFALGNNKSPWHLESRALLVM